MNKDQGHREVLQWRHSDRQFVVDLYLVGFWRSGLALYTVTTLAKEHKSHLWHKWSWPWEIVWDLWDRDDRRRTVYRECRVCTHDVRSSARQTAAERHCDSRRSRSRVRCSVLQPSDRTRPSSSRPAGRVWDMTPGTCPTDSSRSLCSHMIHLHGFTALKLAARVL